MDDKSLNHYEAKVQEDLENIKAADELFGDPMWEESLSATREAVREAEKEREEELRRGREIDHGVFSFLFD